MKVIQQFQAGKRNPLGPPSTFAREATSHLSQSIPICQLSRNCQEQEQKNKVPTILHDDPKTITSKKKKRSKVFHGRINIAVPSPSPSSMSIFTSHCDLLTDQVQRRSEAPRNALSTHQPASLAASTNSQKVPSTNFITKGVGLPPHSALIFCAKKQKWKSVISN